MANPRQTRLFLTIAATSGALLLAGCGIGGSDEVLIGPSSTTPSASASASPSASPSASENGTPVSLGCEQLLSLQNVYDFNPNYATDPNAVTPSEASTLTRIGGKTCGWVNLTSGDTFTVTIAQPDAPTLAAAKAKATTAGGATSAYGSEGYFAASGGAGTATVFSGPYWIVLNSAGFFEAADAGQLVEMVIGNLG